MQNVLSINIPHTLDTAPLKWSGSYHLYLLHYFASYSLKLTHEQHFVTGNSGHTNSLVFGYPIHRMLGISQWTLGNYLIL